MVTQISKDVTDKIFVVLSTGDNPFEGVQAYLDPATASEADKLSTVKAYLLRTVSPYSQNNNPFSLPEEAS